MATGIAFATFWLASPWFKMTAAWFLVKSGGIKERVCGAAELELACSNLLQSERRQQ